MKQDGERICFARQRLIGYASAGSFIASYFRNAKGDVEIRVEWFERLAELARAAELEMERERKEGRLKLETGNLKLETGKVKYKTGNLKVEEMRSGCRMEFKCGAVGRWKRCDFYEASPYSDDCVYLQNKAFCDCVLAQERERESEGIK